MKRESAYGHRINFYTVADMHRHLVLLQALLIPELHLRVTNMSNKTGIKYPGVTLSTCKVNIYNMYITYTFVLPGDLRSLSIH